MSKATEIVDWRLTSDVQNMPMAYCTNCQRQTIQIDRKCKHCKGKKNKNYPLSKEIKKFSTTYPIDDNRGRFHCEDCGRLFVLKRRLYAHYKTHNIKLVYTCRYCGSECYSYDRLLKHRKECPQKTPK